MDAIIQGALFLSSIFSDYALFNSLLVDRVAITGCQMLEDRASPSNQGTDTHDGRVWKKANTMEQFRGQVR
jgi:hypothetical protein